MNKNEVKKILISLRNKDNEDLITHLLGKIDLLSGEKLQQMCIQIGDDEKSIKKYFLEKLEKHNKDEINHIYYYSNAEIDKRESRTFVQIRDVIEKVLKLLEENNLNIYIAGGTVPYILLNQESNRLHDDIDTICKLEDIERLRELFKAEGLYNSHWDSKDYTKDGKDYGFEMKIDDVPFGIHPFEYKDGIITQYSFDPYNKMCKTKTIEIKQLDDYINTYESKNGKNYKTMSLEYIKLTKDAIRRPKDIVDSKKISEYGIRNDVMSRISMYKEGKHQNIKDSIETMKVIFLDIDGVLNSDEYFDKIKDLNIQGIQSEVDIEKIKLLKKAIDETGAKIVLSSSWRYTRNAQDLKELLLQYNIHTDSTPFLKNKRGLEIKKWLENNPNVEDYVILDDEIFDSYDEELLKKLIKISNGNGIGFGQGLQLKDIEQIIQRLGPKRQVKEYEELEI